ncbi:hypothetical protein [Synechococcus elongatus]|uniref:Uncharacterized protein n=1 Tax=Synechococcus elongatus PCC 11801 TaxID=2219813 RepID=A0AAN1QPV2_SYNEL|nr:hypothetical protein [Synechococcus elongatus]AZB73197.1 hypothetical protein DOP62_11155 [Synechococcus elongatus PCC 11801]
MRFNCRLWPPVVLGSLLATGLWAKPAIAADGWWIDQYAVVLFTASGRLDAELAEMRIEGGKTLLVHADSLPPLLLRWVAWRASLQNLQSVAWIQRPTLDRLKRAGALRGYTALQVDDHFFADPLMSLSQLRTMIGEKQLWCSFQPSQFTESLAQACDHVDVQIYRKSCPETLDLAYALGLVGRPKSAIAVYHDGTQQGDRDLQCFRQAGRDVGNDIFVFKWKNPENFINRLLSNPIAARLARLYVQTFQN